MPNRRNELSKQAAVKAQATKQPVEVRSARDLDAKLDEAIASTKPATPARKKAVDAVLKQNKKQIVAPAVPEVHTPQPVKEEKMASRTKKGAKRATKKGSVSKKIPTNRCECGCDTLTRKSFAPGHDQRLVGMIKRGELRSLNAFQSEFARSHGIKLGESKKAEPKKSPAKRTRAA